MLPHTRLLRVLPPAAFFLFISLNSPPTIQSNVDLASPPSNEEVEVLEQLREWVLGEEGRFRALQGVDISDAVREQSQSFELFRSFHDDPDEQREFLSGVPFGEVIHEAGQRYRVDSLLLAAMVETESSFNAWAVSHQGAIGLMQLMPETIGASAGLTSFEPRTNVYSGARYMKQLLDRFDGDLLLALAAYNAGPGNVRRYGGIPPFRETHRYVDRVLHRYVDHHQDMWERSGANDWVFEETL